jgi:hypothetical protein
VAHFSPGFPRGDASGVAAADRRWSTVTRFGVLARARKALSFALALACVAAPARAQDPHEIKADMLYNIAKFIRWPDHCFSRTHGQLIVAILGDDPLAEALAATLSQRSVNGRPVFVRVVRRVQDAAGCQIIYVASSESGRMAEVIHAVEGTPALTVADSTGFVAVGGMVDFASENERVRFEINQSRAEHAGLRISAKLLALAHVVEPTP